MTNTRSEAAGYEQEASAWAAAGRPDHAAHLYARVVDLEPHNWRARMQLAACLAGSGQPTAAADHYVEIARHYATQRTGPETLAIAHQVLQLDPTRFGYGAMADVLRAIGRDAGPLCRRAARTHHAAGRDDEASQLLHLCGELDPFEIQSWRDLAQLYLNHEMPAEAAQALRTAAQRLLAAGNNGRYAEFAKAVLTMEPHDLQTLRELPRVLMRMGEPQRAVVELSNLLRVNPGDVVGYETLAHAFAAIGRTTVSLTVLEQLTTELAMSGRREEAEAIIERASGWRGDDVEFCCSVIALRVMQPSQPISLDDVRPTTPEGTVVLRLADLTRGAQPTATQDEVFDATDLVELADGEDSVVLRLSDLSRVQLTEHTAAYGQWPAPEPGEHTAAYGHRPSPDPSARTSERDHRPSPDPSAHAPDPGEHTAEYGQLLASAAGEHTHAYGQVPASAASEHTHAYGQPPPPDSTQTLDLRDIIEMQDDDAISPAPAPREQTLVGMRPQQ